MHRIDAAAIERFGIPRLLLMEHAGLALARETHRLLPAHGRIVACCGMGFNGGDGLAAARHLSMWGHPVDVVLAGRLANLRDEPAVYANILRRLRVRIIEVPARRSVARVESSLRPEIVLDALLGIGARGNVREPMASLIAWMNRQPAPIVSADIPSGLNGDTGAVQGLTVNAAVTVTFGAPKRGCLTGAGPAHAGRLIVDSISLPQRACLTP